jgi:hypothetical protein
MREFNLDKIKATGTTVGDVYFPNVSLLLPFDGSNGATSTSDSSNQNHTVTFNGAQISSAQSKFGGTSLLLDGSNDYLSIGGAEWNSNLNSGDFTVEFWIRFDTVGSGEQRIITNYNGNNGWGVALWSGGGGTDYFDGYWYDGSWRYMQYNIGGSSRYTTPSINTWYHVAFVRNGNDWGLYLNGTAESTRTVSGSIISSSLGSLEVGRQHQGNYFVDGYMDDLRITKGLARYTSNFTPPTSTHLTQAGDVNKQIIVNSAADGVAIGTGGINQARIAKAWVNFDADPSVSIRQSYNVSSITDTATGRFTINFSTAMLDADYCFSGSGGNQTGTTSGGRMVGPDGTKTTSALPVRYVTWGSTGTRNVYDNDYHCLIVFGN